MKQCKPGPKVIQSTENSVRTFFEKFNKTGLTADFPDGRGNRSKIVTLDFVAQGPRQYKQGRIINFEYDQELNDSVLMGIELLSTAQMVFTPTQPPKDSPQSVLNRGFLILVDQCNNEILRTPLANLCKALNGNKTTFVNMRNVAWDNSGVLFNGASGITTANALPFKINFQK